MPEVLERTKTKHLALLHEFGFVHVTGLVLRFFEPLGAKVIGNAEEKLRGHWNVSNGMLVAVMENGEIWIASEEIYDNDFLYSRTRILSKVCPKGVNNEITWERQTFFVPQSFLVRVADPYKFSG